MTNLTSRFMLLLLPLVATLLHQRVSYAQSTEYQMQPNIPYGAGIVAAPSKPFERELTLDAYILKTSVTEAILRPAVILAFGGALHRGETGDFQFKEDGASDSSMNNLCFGISV